MKELRISVRHLVEFILREGDISRSTMLTSKKAMLEGGRIHRKLQRSMGSSYRSEVTLSHTTSYETFSLTVWGRADGIFLQKSLSVIDEIKGTYSDTEMITEPVPVHLAQALCYAYMYAVSENKSKVRVQIRYCNMKNERIKKFTSDHSFKELKTFWDSLLEKYYRWAAFLVSWKDLRNESVKGMEFPFEYRPGQQGLTGDVYRTIYRKKQLYVQAATGTGKTMSVVFPSVHALSLGLAERIFYLTAKTVTGRVANEAAELLREKGLRLKSIYFTAKDKLCPCEETVCDPNVCPRAKGHYDRINDVLYEVLTGRDSFTREEILSAAANVCPYELQLDLADFCDMIICDYNYAFDPEARLKRFFSDTGASKDSVLLIDEAHNLPDRAREMFSAQISEAEVTAVKNAMKGKDRKVSLALARILKILGEIREECGEELTRIGFSEKLKLALLSAAGKLEEFFENGGAGGDDNVLNFYFGLRHFLTIASLFGEDYIAYAETTGMEQSIKERSRRSLVRVKLYCVNPARNLQEVFGSCRSSVLFSATFLPIRYYQDLLSEEDAYAVYVPSPFPKENRIILNGVDVTSRYKSRNPKNCAKIAEYLLAMTKAKKGKYMAFFPSYALMRMVYESYEQIKPPDLKTMLQEQKMAEEQRDAFLASFESDDRWLLGFCVMGGVFAEGIDLFGDRLIGAAVVGTGIPMITKQSDLLKEYYNETGHDGFNYAYRFPGLNKVMQAAGRVIRTSTDRGVILLLDDRFSESHTRKYFPREWDDCRKCSLETVNDELRKFWNEET